MRHHAADIVIAGAGPAGLAAASALARQGLSVICVAPDPTAPWANNFGVWADTFPFPEAVSRVWERARVIVDSERQHVLRRAYARVDNAALQQLLLDRLSNAGGQLVNGRVLDLQTDGEGPRVHIDTGISMQARLVVDATGHHSPLTARSPARALQVAWGIDADITGLELDPDELGLMDWRAAPGESGAPSFLYTMPLGGDRVFVEETSLASDPPLSMSVLSARLHARIAAMGGTVQRVHATERCRIPLDGGWPRFRPGVVPIGGAASMVHPATGYQLSRGLSAAAALAAAVDIDLPCADLTAKARAAVLPGSSRATRALHLYGLGVVLGLDAPGTREHFHAFFSTGDAAWRTMLADDAAPGEVARVMLRMAAIAPWSVRRRLPSLSAFSRTFRPRAGLQGRRLAHH